MRENVGSWDRSMRAVAGPLLMGWGFRRRGRLTGAAALVGGAMLTGTAITKVCPMNAALGLDTSTRAGGGKPADAMTRSDTDQVDEMAAAAASVAAAQPMPTIG